MNNMCPRIPDVEPLFVLTIVLHELIYCHPFLKAMLRGGLLFIARCAVTSIGARLLV
jgi:hypothetical protein